MGSVLLRIDKCARVVIGFVLIVGCAVGGSVQLQRETKGGIALRSGAADSTYNAWVLLDTAAMKKISITDALDKIECLGAQPRHFFSWALMASFRLPVRLYDSLEALPWVRGISAVRKVEHRLPQEKPLSKRTGSTDDSVYGAGYEQLKMVSIPGAHAFICSTRGQVPGEGITIACLDAGFDLSHPCFDSLKQRGGIRAESSFVDNECDSLGVDFCHGARVLSLICGYLPGRFAGSAYGAEILLARTECGSYERHVEEDNWIAALQWAVESGADIVTSSLAYRFDFDAGEGGYTYDEMDGATTGISRKAAQYARQHNTIIVNAMGNEGAVDGQGNPTVSAPADAPGVISVGGVDRDLSLWDLSSRGPAADGRIVPDLCAQADSVVLPSCTGDGYIAGSGTSFATPVVAGICALIMQTQPGCSAATVRSRLYESCQLSPFQDSIDAAYGRGIPDALYACTHDFSDSAAVRDRPLVRRNAHNLYCYSLSANNGNRRVRYVATLSTKSGIRSKAHQAVPGHIQVRLYDCMGTMRYESYEQVPSDKMRIEGTISLGNSDGAGFFLLIMRYGQIRYTARIPVY